jgi:hypothetical protein
MSQVLTKNFIAEAAVVKYRIVKFGTADGKVLQAAVDTDAMFGVSTEIDSAINKRCDVHVAGIAEVEYGGNVTRGDLLTSDANGKAVAATRHTHTENTAATYTQNAVTAAASAKRVIGTAMVSGVAGDIGSVQLGPAAA